MKYIFLVGAITFISSVANANANLTLVKVNCDDIKLSLNTVIDNKMNFSAYWNDAGVFPNPPKYTEIGDTIRSKIKKFKVQCPEFSASYDGNMAEIKSNDYAGVLARFSTYDLEPFLYSVSGYTYPNIKKGFFNNSYSINLKDFSLKSGIWDINQGDNLGEDILKYQSIQKDSIIGYKINGGELKPLLYDRKVLNYKQDFESANTIDIFHKISSNNAGVTIQRIFIDKPNGLLRIYKKSPFPSH